jgi:stage II sporulation protein D
MWLKQSLIILICALVFMPLNVFQPNYTYGSENQDQYILRVRVKQSSQKILLQSTDSLFLYHPHEESFFSIGKSSSPFIASICSAVSEIYYLQIPLQNYSIQSIETIRKSYFASSNLSFYVPLDETHFSVRVGPFYSEKEASFLLHATSSSFAGAKVVSIPKNTSICLLDLNSGIYIQKTISNQTYTTTPIFRISPNSKQNSIHLGNYSYYGDIWIHTSSSNTLCAVNHVDMETYLKGVVPAEISANWHLDALKAQAITARTFALKRAFAARQKSTAYFDVTDDTYCQVYLGTRQSQKTNQAVDETKNLVLIWNQQLITSPFHSCSGGMTESNANAWNSSPYPYLCSVESPGEEISPHYSWYKNYTRENFIQELKKLLIEKCNIKANTIDKWEIQAFPDSHRVQFVNVYADQNIYNITGLQFQSYFGLKSSWFGIYQDTPENLWKDPPPLLKSKLINSYQQSYVYVYGKGWGHGVGLPQYGAQAAALRGEPFSVILTRYYRDVSIASMQPFYQLQSALPSMSTSSYPQVKTFLPTNFATYSSNVARLSFSSSDFETQNAHQKIEIGSHPTVDMMIETGSDVFGVAFHLFYSPTISNIEKETCKVGNFLLANNVHVNSIIKKETTPDGRPYLNVALSREGKDNGGVSGSGTLFSFRLETLSLGSGSLFIDNISVLDAKLNSIQTETAPLEYTIFKTDRDPPSTQIISHPDPVTNQKTIQFRWTGDDIQTRTEELFYSYQLNIEPWSPFTAETSKVFHLTEDGKYIFRVKARDNFGNEDPDPATFVFTLDTVPPTLSFDEIPQITYTDSITIKGHCEYTAQLTINGSIVPIEADGSFSHIFPLIIGTNVLNAQAIDQAGNITTIEYTLIREVFEPIFIWLQIGNQTAYVNQKLVTIDCRPFTEKGRTLIPLRFIAESFNASVDWYEAEQQITIEISAPFHKKIDLWLNNDIARVDDTEEIKLDVAPFTIPPGRTVVPLRFIAESFQASIEWFPQDQSIEIVFPKKTSILSLHMVQNWFENSFHNLMNLFNGRG